MHPLKLPTVCIQLLLIPSGIQPVVPADSNAESTASLRGTMQEEDDEPEVTTPEVHLGAPTTLRRHRSMPNIKLQVYSSYTRVFRVPKISDSYSGVIASRAEQILTEEQRTTTVVALDRPTVESSPRKQHFRFYYHGSRAKKSLCCCWIRRTFDVVDSRQKLRRRSTKQFFLPIF